MKLVEVVVSGRAPFAASFIPFVKQKARDEVLLVSRTGRGGHVYILLPEQNLQILRNVIKEYDSKTGGIYSWTVEEVSRGPGEFFRFLRERHHIDTDVRELGLGELEVAVPPAQMGRLIGRGGKTIKAIQSHLGYFIKVVPAYYVSAHPASPVINIYEEKVSRNGDVDLKLVGRVSSGQWKPPFFAGEQNKSYGFAITNGYVAPWEIPWKLVRREE